MSALTAARSSSRAGSRTTTGVDRRSSSGRRAFRRRRAFACLHRWGAGLLLCACVLPLFTFGCRAAMRSTGSEDLGAGRKWALLVYMNGDNELEPQAIDSLNELESVDLSGEGISILALVDRAAGYDTSNGDWAGTRLFEVQHDPAGMNPLIVSKSLASSELGLTAGGNEELDMGSPETLDHFLAYASTHYPAEHSALIIWGHGSGWRAAGADLLPSPVEALSRAVSFDDSSSSDPLFTAELAEALEEHTVDIIGFDCCSEAMIEVAYEIRARASYMIAAEDVTFAEGWSYRAVLEHILSRDRSPTGVLEAIVAAYSEDEAETAGATISAIDLSRVDGVKSALDELSLALSSWVRDTPAQTALRSLLFNEVEDFYRIPGDLDIDLGDCAQVVADNIPEAREAASALAMAVEAAVLLEWHHPQGNPRAHGLAVHYVPLNSDGTAGLHADAYFRNLPSDYPLAFVAESEWVPRYPSGPGLLYRLWYEVF